jgi:hypothetical protein
MLTAFALVVPLFAVVVAAAAVAAAPALPDGTAAGASCPCPLHSHGALLFEDISRRVPDFWYEDSLEVQEIIICPRGISFIFLGHDEGSLFLSTLVFVNPDGEGRPADSQELRSPWVIRHNQDQYRSLVESISRITGAAPGAGGGIIRGGADPGERPRIIDPVHKLTLRWHGEEVQLRGYLDVYLAAML